MDKPNPFIRAFLENSDIEFDAPLEFPQLVYGERSGSSSIYLRSEIVIDFNCCELFFTISHDTDVFSCEVELKEHYIDIFRTL